MRHLLFTLFLLSLCSACKKDIVVPTATPSATIQSLNAEWEMRQADTDDWMPIAKIPSTVHTALLENKRIEDPFYRNNEAKLQWIETKNWEYRKRFDVEAALLTEEVIELNFKGLDTYAEVYLNGQKILEADNMFRSWLIDVKALLKENNNELRIEFHNPIEKENQKWKALGYELPDGSKRALTRKAGFHYGWDWGPRFVTMGPWQPVELRAWSKIFINTVHYRAFPIADGEPAEVQAFFDIDATVPGDATISVEVDGHTFHKQINITTGNNRDSLSFTLKEAKLWWPNGFGQQHLYNISGSVTALDFSDKKEDRIGIREIKLEQKESSDGLSFTFVVNGKPIFAKGANYIPQDIFQDRVTDVQYTKLLTDAKRANMNMLRVWGGGIYEQDIFYRTCDELGLLVWQDFMFANAMVPGDEAFRQNVAEEAKEQVSRLANHPSIALWCGNNEISEGWHRWGWQDGLQEEQKTKIWNDYKAVFNNILPEAVKEFHPDIAYWESSPQLGRGDANHVNVGDSHYWGIWHDAEPFENFKTKVPRFMSEFGFQSLPSMSTIKTFTLPEDRNLDSEVMKAHQKHSRGTALIKEYMARDYRTPKDFDNFVYVSQLLQAEGMKLGMNAHLMRQPYCMGSLYWQLNDCWPVASWSSIDSKGNWKALHYAARKAFEPIHLAIDLTQDRISPMVTNNTADTLPLLSSIKVFDLDGNISYDKIIQVSLLPFSNKRLPSILTGQVNRYKDPATLVLQMTLMHLDSSFITNENLYMVKPKNLKLKKSNIKTTITKTTEGYMIRLVADVLAKSVYLEMTEVDGWFEDNYFDMLAGEVKEVLFVPDDGEVELTLEVRSLVDSY